MEPMQFKSATIVKRDECWQAQITYIDEKRKRRRKTKFLSSQGKKAALEELEQVHQHVSEKDTHLARIGLVNQGVESQVDRLNRIGGVREHALAIGREVHARIVHGESDQSERRARASAGPFRTHALRLHHVAVLIELGGDNAIRQLLPAEFLAE